jgi:NAD+ kinase
MEPFRLSSHPTKSAAIVSKPNKPELVQILPELLAWFQKNGYRIVIDDETSAYVQGPPTVPREELASQPLDFAVVLGGDGTLLSAARVVCQRNIPILGVNLGSLGFLTEVPLPALYPTLEALQADRLWLDERSMLDCKVLRGGKNVASYCALNDVVIGKSTISRLNHLELLIDGLFVSGYKADGLIVSTPTGSTAYSLAAGGPILTPSVDALLVTPVSPHSLTHRSLVVRDTVCIEVIVKTGEEQVYLSVDGQLGMPLDDSDLIRCQKSDNKVRLLRLQKTFFEVLRTKLKWGER